jgi:YkoY family integral membrane protein
MTVPTLPELVAALPVIGSLVVIEGLLSVDNALAIAALAGRLPVAQRRRALTFGMIGAYAFRVVALFLASWVIGNAWVKGVGALYLIYLMVSELRSGGKEMLSQAHGTAHFWPTFFAIQWIDLTLSFDNVVAAVALSPKLWVVCTGVLLGMVALRFLAGACIALLERFPVLRPTAFILVGYVGLLLLYEVIAGREVGVAWKCGGIALIVAIALIVPGSSRGGRRRQRESSR